MSAKQDVFEEVPCINHLYVLIMSLYPEYISYISYLEQCSIRNLPELIIYKKNRIDFCSIVSCSKWQHLWARLGRFRGWGRNMALLPEAL